MFAAQFAVSFARDFGGRVAAARGFRPVRECRLSGMLRFYDFEGPSGIYGVGLDSDPPALEQGPAFDAVPPTNDDGTPYPAREYA